MDILSIEALTKDFVGVRALNKLDINIKEGTIHSLIGPNGSGKTTFFNVVSGLLPATEGKIYFDGTDITNLSPQIRTGMGISRTFQIPQVLPDMTCLENVMLGMHCRTKADIRGTFFHLPFTSSLQENKVKEQAFELLQSVGLADSARRLARDLAWVEEQLLQLARAQAMDPKLLMLDEPTAGMGYTETEEIKKVIKQMRGAGITLVLVAHDIKLVMGVSDWVTVLNFGNKIAEGSAEQVQHNPEVLKAYLGEE